MSFPRYPEYKASGVEWLGEVPAHWSLAPLKHAVRLVTTKATERVQPLGLENIESWTGRLLATSTEFEGDGVAFQDGDILFGKLRPYLAKVYVAEGPGEAVGDFHVLRPQEHCLSSFLQFQMLTRSFIDIVDGSTFGSKMPRASWDFVGSMSFTLPPKAEQQSIAAFLDRETAKIDALVAEQRRLMELLKEKRQAVISHAVTKGLNPDAPMKDSGVEWLGDIPAHWEIVKIKRLMSSIEQGWSPQCESFPAESSGEWGVLKVGCVNGGSFRPEENKLLPNELEPLPALALHAGDLLVSRANTRELVGSAAVALIAYPNLMLCDKLYRLRFHSDRANSQFVAFFLGSSEARSQLELDATGASASMVNIAQSAITEILMPTPSVDEQRAIVTSVNSELTRLQTMSTEATRAVHILLERRTALISAAVTGQIDVRGLASEAAA